MRGAGDDHHAIDGVVLAVTESTSPVLVILRALGLGDFLTAVPAYRALSEAFVGHRILLAAPPALGPLAALTGVIDEVIPCGPLEPLPATVHNPEIAVNLHGQGPQSHRILLATAPARLIAFASPDVPESCGGPPWRPGEHEVHRWARLLREEGIPCDPSRLDLPVPAAGIDGGYEDATVIHPGAARQARRWPIERWAEVARFEAARGRTVLVSGGPDERREAEQLAARAGLPAHCVVAGLTGVLELAGLVGRAGRVLCCDTGVAHLATAMGTPSVVLFGPTSPETWGPPPERAWHRVLWKGRVGDPLGDRPDAGLLEIQVEDVIHELETLPPRRRPAGAVAEPV